MPKQIKVLLAHPGTQHSFQLAKQLEKNGLLFEFWSPFVVPEKSCLYYVLKRLPHTLFKKLSNRIISGVSRTKIKTIWWFEINYLIKGKLKGFDEKLIYERNKQFQMLIPDKSLNEADVIIGFDTSSFLLVKRAKQKEKIFILDQSIAHPNSKAIIFEKLNSLYPHLKLRLPFKSEQLTALEKVEHENADYIITASTFTKKTLVENQVDDKKIVINPYGVDNQRFNLNQLSTKEKLRFLFVGSLTARKGINILLKVWKELNPLNAELLLVGPAEKEIIDQIPQLASINYLGKIAHQDLQLTVSSCDVFVLPSFFEGFGLVILEAMACGLPVISTEATGAPDIIESGIDGIVYNSFDTEKLKASIQLFLESPDKAKTLGLNARKKVENFTWDAYGFRWAQLINNLFDCKC
ncbi:glycosyltransferase family 4 protein [Pedobacter sp.]